MDTREQSVGWEGNSSPPPVRQYHGMSRAVRERRLYPTRQLAGYLPQCHRCWQRRQTPGSEIQGTVLGARVSTSFTLSLSPSFHRVMQSRPADTCAHNELCYRLGALHLGNSKLVWVASLLQPLQRFWEHCLRLLRLSAVPVSWKDSLSQMTHL